MKAQKGIYRFMPHGFFFQRRYVAPVYESSGIMLKLADMGHSYTLQSWQCIHHVTRETENSMSECMLVLWWRKETNAS